MQNLSEITSISRHPRPYRLRVKHEHLHARNVLQHPPHVVPSHRDQHHLFKIEDPPLGSIDLGSSHCSLSFEEAPRSSSTRTHQNHRRTKLPTGPVTQDPIPSHPKSETGTASPLGPPSNAGRSVRPSGQQNRSTRFRGAGQATGRKRYARPDRTLLRPCRLCRPCRPCRSPPPLTSAVPRCVAPGRALLTRAMCRSTLRSAA